MKEIKSKKDLFKAVLLGFFIGLAVIIPGLSSATIAIVFGLYASLLYAFGNIFKDFKRCFKFLLPIVIGLAIGFVLGFVVVQKLIELFPFVLICLFAGLMIGSFPAVFNEIKGVKFTAGRIILFVLGVIIPIALGVLSIIISHNSGGVMTVSVVWVLLYFVIGFFASFTQIIPGLSCSAMLMMIGQYSVIFASIHLSVLKANPLILLVLFSLALGFIVGFIIFSKGIHFLLEKKRDSSYCAIVGLSLGSIMTMFINPEVAVVYKTWTSVGQVVAQFSIGVPLLLLGFVITYLLVRYQRKHDKEKQSQEGNKN